MPVGQLSSLASTFDSTLTRDQLIQAAYETAKQVEEGQTISAEQLNVGITRLNMIVREVDQSGNWVWTVQEAKHLSLQANVGVYDSNSGLPTNISELVSVVYRDATGSDSEPLRILKAEQYEEIRDKMDTGVPEAVYLTNDIQLANRRLYVWPHLTSVATQSKVVGSDNLIYKCIYPHTSTTTNKPITGANWRMVWELSSASVTAWATSTAYTMSESLRLVIRRPIYDFDAASNTPDFPIQWPRLLMLRLAIDVGTVYGTPQPHLEMLQSMVRGSFTDIFPSTKPKSNDLHNKAKYF
jgi:hypothetical protein